MCGVFKNLIFALAFFALILPQNARAETKTLMVFGDSLVAGHGLKRDEALPAQLEARLTKEGLPVKVYNAGVSGDTTTSALNRLDYSLNANKPDYVIIVLGGNDMLRGIDPVITRENLRRMLENLKSREIPVMLGGMRALGTGSKQIDIAYLSMYQTLAKQYDAVLYPFILEGVALKPDLNQQDGVHPTAKGVGIIVDNILPSVAELLVKKTGAVKETDSTKE